MNIEHISHVMDIVKKACSGDKKAETELRSIADTATFWNGNSVCVAIFSAQQRGCIQYGYVSVYKGNTPDVSCFPLPSSFKVAAIAYKGDLFYFISEKGEIRSASYSELSAIWDKMLTENSEFHESSEMGLIDNQVRELFYMLTSGEDSPPESVSVPFIGTFDYSEKTKTYAAFHTHKELGPLSVTIKANDKHDMVECMAMIHEILGNAVALDNEAKALLMAREGMDIAKIDILRLASIDCYINGEFDFFYDITDELLTWVTVCFSKTMQPINITYD